MNKRLLLALAIITSHGIATSNSRGDVRLPRVLSSHMVLQRNSNVTIWGWAESGEQVTIAADWIGTNVTLTANAEGNWQTNLQTSEPGAAHSITIQATNRIELTEILFGEVWLASGQSNMEMPLAKASGAYTGIKNAKQEVQNATNSQIRLFQVGNFSSKDPLEDVQPGIVMYGVPTIPMPLATVHAQNNSQFCVHGILLRARITRTAQNPSRNHRFFVGRYGCRSLDAIAGARTTWIRGGSRTS